MDPGSINAFTRVCDALWAGMTEMCASPRASAGMNGWESPTQTKKLRDTGMRKRLFNWQGQRFVYLNLSNT